MGNTTMRALRAALLQSVFVNSARGLWTRILHQSSPSSIFQFCNLDRCSESDGTNFIDFDQLPSEMDEYHLLIVWNGVESVSGSATNYRGKEWDYALEWSQKKSPLDLMNADMRPTNVKMWNSGKTPSNFQGLSRSQEMESLFDARIFSGDSNYPIGIFQSSSKMDESLMVAYPDNYAPQGMLFAKSVELYVRVPSQPNEEETAEEEPALTWAEETPLDYKCPSVQCWTFDEATASCILKPGCTNLKCGATSIRASFAEGAFGGMRNVQVEGVTPIIDINNGFIFDCPLGECGMTHEVIGNDITGYMIEFEFKIAPEADGRPRRHNVIDLGDSLRIVTEQDTTVNVNPVDLVFKCTYPMGIDLSADSNNAHNAVAVSGRKTSAFGALDKGFNIIVGDPANRNAYMTMGSAMKVAVTWDVLLPDITFHIDECRLEHGPITVALVKGSCYSSALNVKKLEREIETISSFSFRTFMIAGQRGAQQSIACKIKVCERGGCDLLISDSQCPNDREDAPYVYTLLGDTQ